MMHSTYNFKKPILVLVLVATLVRIIEVAEVLIKLKSTTCLIKRHATRDVWIGGTAPFILTSTLYENEQSFSALASYIATERDRSINLGEGTLGTRGGVYCVEHKTCTLARNHNPTARSSFSHPCQYNDRALCMQFKHKQTRWDVQVRCEPMNSAVAEDCRFSKYSAWELTVVYWPGPHPSSCTTYWHWKRCHEFFQVFEQFRLNFRRQKKPQTNHILCQNCLFLSVRSKYMERTAEVVTYSRRCGFESTARD